MKKFLSCTLALMLAASVTAVPALANDVDNKGNANIVVHGNIAAMPDEYNIEYEANINWNVEGPLVDGAAAIKSVGDSTITNRSAILDYSARLVSFQPADGIDIEDGLTLNVTPGVVAPGMVAANNVIGINDSVNNNGRNLGTLNKNSTWDYNITGEYEPVDGHLPFEVTNQTCNMVILFNIVHPTVET